jgi:hypothetical protein
MGLLYRLCRGKSSGEGLFVVGFGDGDNQTLVGFSEMMDAVLFVIDEV